MIIEVTLADIQVGDVVTRMLAGTIPMQLKVTHVEDGVINCGEWTFDQATGVEEDHELGWGVSFGYTGSYLTKVERQTDEKHSVHWPHMVDPEATEERLPADRRLHLYLKLAQKMRQLGPKANGVRHAAAKIAWEARKELNGNQ